MFKSRTNTPGANAELIIIEKLSEHAWGAWYALTTDACSLISIKNYTRQFEGYCISCYSSYLAIAVECKGS